MAERSIFRPVPELPPEKALPKRIKENKMEKLAQNIQEAFLT